MVCTYYVLSTPVGSRASLVGIISKLLQAVIRLILILFFLISVSQTVTLEVIAIYPTGPYLRRSTVAKPRCNNTEGVFFKIVIDLVCFSLVTPLSS